jgi:peptidyl-prolyl cis-trans isomerase SurA
MMISRILGAALLAAVTLSLPPLAVPVLAQGQGIVAIVNDQPITERDITEHITLVTILKEVPPEGISRKQALRRLIDERVKIAEATRYKMMPTDNEIRDQVARVSKGMDTTPEGLLARLKKQGVSEPSFNRYIGTLLGFNRVMSSKYRNQISASDAEVDAKMSEIKSKADSQISKIMNDPRMKGVTVYSLLQINLPVEANDSMLLQARAVEAAQVAQRFKGCDSARAAAQGVFNVKIGKRFDADAAKLPKPLKAALDKAGVGRAVGPIRGKGGIELLALCGTRKITPPKPDFKLPTRAQVERAVINQKYDDLEENFLKTLRPNVYVEYRNSSYAQQ